MKFLKLFKPKPQNSSFQYPSLENLLNDVNQSINKSTLNNKLKFVFVSERFRYTQKFAELLVDKLLNVRYYKDKNNICIITCELAILNKDLTIIKQEITNYYHLANAHNCHLNSVEVIK